MASGWFRWIILSIFALFSLFCVIPFFYMLYQDAPAVPSLEKSVLESCFFYAVFCKEAICCIFFFLVLDPCTLFCHSKLPKWSLRKPISGDRSTRMMTSQKAKKLALCCVIFFCFPCYVTFCIISFLSVENKKIIDCINERK